MRKTFAIIALFALLFLLLFPLHVNAATIVPKVTLDKTVVNPGQNITVTVDFGQLMGSYDLYIKFDTSLVQYASITDNNSTGKPIAVAHVSGNEVLVSFADTSNPSSTVSVTFTAKTVTTSNPTNFSITADGMATPAAVSFDPITTPMIAYFVVEPAYDAYTITISQPSNIAANTETPIDVTISSAQGRAYNHLRLVATVTTPSGATMQLLGTNSSGVQSDVILSGWGDPTTGFGLGPGAVKQVYNFRGLFSANGTYKLTLNLIDRDNSDAVIATKTATFTVGPIPTKLPKTGTNLYLYAGIVLVILIAAYAIVNRRDKNNRYRL